jgi:hypothetical protein
MPQYFKLVCLPDNEPIVTPEWYRDEFLAGRARFGWSGPGSDLRPIKAKMDAGRWGDRTKHEADVWYYTQFLIERIKVGDRIVVQPEQPLRTILLGEVIKPGYEFSPGDLPDFNHVLHIKPLTNKPIPVNAKVISASLKHDLSKRGHYYEIYPAEAIRDLDAIVKKLAHDTLDYSSIRTDEDTFDDTKRRVTDLIIDNISRSWKAQHFEILCERICKSLDYVQIKERSDRHKGWDILIRIINPITGSILMDDIPVQCKNYTGDVSDDQPITDLERSVRALKAPIAYLFIIGNLTNKFRSELARRKEALEKEIGSRVQFEIVEQDRIAELYSAYITKNNISAIAES